MKTSLELHDSVVLSLAKIKASSAFEVKLRGKADGLLTSIKTRQFMATAFLFREIFTVTGPLSRYLQTVDIDFSKAVPMIDSAITSLQKMRDMPDHIFRVMADDDFGDIEWRTTHVHHRRRLSGSEDESVENPNAAWMRNTCYVFWTKCFDQRGEINLIKYCLQCFQSSVQISFRSL